MPLRVLGSHSQTTAEQHDAGNRNGLDALLVCGPTWVAKDATGACYGDSSDTVRVNVFFGKLLHASSPGSIAELISHVDHCILFLNYIQNSAALPARGMLYSYLRISQIKLMVFSDA